MRSEVRIILLIIFLCALDIIGYLALFAIDEGGLYGASVFAKIILLTLSSILYILSFPYVIFFKLTGIDNIIGLLCGGFVGCFIWAFIIEFLILEFFKRKKENKRISN